MAQLRYLAFVLLAVACDCSTTPVERPCTSDAECAGDMCVDGFCTEPTDAGALDGPALDALICGDDRPVCGSGAIAACCGADEVCMVNRCAEDCGALVRCGDACCGETQTCEDNVCVAQCDDITQRCGVANDVCCTTEQACLSDSCVDLGVPCEFTEDCDITEICLPSAMRCVPRDSVEVCEFVPPRGVFSPSIGCRWTPNMGDSVNSFGVVMTPSVANLTDDNGDGLTNTDDIPDIVFTSYNRTVGCCQADALVRIVSGQCNDDGSMRTIATLPGAEYDNSNGILLANLHPAAMVDEANPEIVASRRNGTLVAWRRTSLDGSTWEEMWRTDALSDSQSSSGAQPGAADFNGDGQPEIYVGNVVLNGLTGEILWNGDVTVGTNAGVGNNAFLGPVSTAADLDLDGNLELIAGNTVYNGIDGSEIWTFAFTSMNGTCAGGVRGCDGYDAIGNFDDDDFAEVVMVRQGVVFIVEHDGTLKEEIPVPRDDCPSNESGPPTVADFDGDGRAEIGTAGADFYAVVDLDCAVDPLPAGCDSFGILWKVPNQDCSSRATGSSVFDFDGDGSAEVVYADETSFRIFAGPTGEILYEDLTHMSNTRMEMPIVVDVDNDGKSEVVVPEPNTDRSFGGIEIWEDADNNWVRTRRIWNQHAYHVTNITEDGQVPAAEEPNWLNSRLNNFRQNVQPGGLFDAPDLVVTDVRATGCAGDGSVQLQITVGNQGALGAAAGVPVAAYGTLMGGAEEFIGTVPTTRFLLPGQEETVLIEWLPSTGWTVNSFSVRAVVDSDGMGGSTYNECNEDNNEGMSAEGLAGCGLG